MSAEVQNNGADPISFQKKRSGSEWEIITGLREGDRHEEKPLKFDGYLHKKRNPPLKGWHKRYFVLEEGTLTYSKSPNDHLKSRHHGKIDIGLAVLSFNKKKKKIDIDAEEFVYHIRTKNSKWFEEWVVNLRKHRLYRHTELNYGTQDAPLLTQLKSESMETPIESTKNGTSGTSYENLKRIREGSFRNSGKVITWLIDNDGIEQCSKDLTQVNMQLMELETDLEKLETLPLILQSAMDSPILLTPETSKRGSISKILSFKSSHRRERRLAETANSKSSASNPSLTTKFGENDKLERPSSLTTSTVTVNTKEQLQELKLCSEFISKAQSVHSLLKNLARRISTERERLKRAVDEKSSMHSSSTSGSDTYILSLKQALQDSLKLNDDLKSKLSEVGKLVDLSDDVTTVNVPTTPVLETQQIVSAAQHPSLHDINRSHSLSSRASESFFDAAERLDEESSMSSDSSSSDFSDHDIEAGLSEDMGNDDRSSEEKYQTGRRCKLPAPMTVNDTGLISLLTRNIGKDLTRISMPVTLNEPLNTLQIMCEELEYSDLLDKASSCDDPYERMVYVAAFAVSAYASSNTRAATKPFNPLLGETYECIRLDKGWKFLAEQVSHHPPISVCHADSQNFVFKQDCRVKTKFWGKSLEVHPVGSVSVALPRHNEEYVWKKVTTCIHNLLGGQRWVDQYGEMVITCKATVKCKLNFIKASYWSDKKHEVHGTVTGPDGQVQHYLFGKWTEGLYCKTENQANRCIWRAGNLPEDYEMYYGFTRFAIELNELSDDERPYLPKTDTRFRPDQRLLEEGKISEAEAEKLRLEKQQREVRKKRETDGREHKPVWFRKFGEKNGEYYKYTDEYWKCRRDPGFEKLKNIPTLW